MSIKYEVQTFEMVRTKDNHGYTIYSPVESVLENDLACVDIDPNDGGTVIHSIDLVVTSDNDERDIIIDISIGNWVPNFRDIANEIEAILCEQFEFKEFDEDDDLGDELSGISGLDRFIGRPVKDGEW